MKSADIYTSIWIYLYILIRYVQIYLKKAVLDDLPSHVELKPNQSP